MMRRRQQVQRSRSYAIMLSLVYTDGVDDDEGASAQARIPAAAVH
jgi:hypothetical protein